MDEKTGRPVTPERATALSKALHDGPLQSMHAARIALLIAVPCCRPSKPTSRGAVEDLLDVIRVVNTAMNEFDLPWPLVNAGFPIPDRRGGHIRARTARPGRFR